MIELLECFFEQSRFLLIFVVCLAVAKESFGSTVRLGGHLSKRCDTFLVQSSSLVPASIMFSQRRCRVVCSDFEEVFLVFSRMKLS